MKLLRYALFKTELTDITPQKLRKLDDKELSQVWLRLNQWYVNAKKEKRSIENIVNAALWTRTEMKSRGFKVDETLELSKEVDKLERELRKRTAYGNASPMPKFIDDILKKLPNEILLVRDFAMVGGSAAVTENPEDIDLILRAKYDESTTSYLIDASLLNVALRRFFDSSKKGLHIVPSPQGSFTDYIPVYDLICRRRIAGVERIEPEPPNYDGKNRIIKRELKPFSSFIPPKPIMPMFTEFFDVEEIWNNWAKDRMPIIVEPKLNGFRAIMEKSGNKISLWFEGKREDNQLEKKVFSRVRDTLSQIPDDFIVDCDVGMKHAGKRLPRNEIVTLNADDPIIFEPDTLVITVFDLPYWKKDLHELPFTERRNRLEEFFNTYLAGKAEKLFELVPSQQAKNKNELKQLAKWAFSFPLSEGLVAKTLGGAYELDGATNEWSKLKHEVEIKAIVLEKKRTKTDTFVYAGGVSVSQSYKGVNITELGNKKYVNLGDSFSTKINANIGDIITVKIEELIPHINKKTGLEEIAWYAPRVIDKDDTRTTPYSIEQVIDLAKRGGIWQSIKKEKLFILSALGEIKKITPEEEMGETRAGLSIRNWEKNWFSMLPKKNHLRFVYQHHWRGMNKDEVEYSEEKLLNTQHSVHGDLRLESDDALWGFTIFLGETKDIRDAGGDRLMNLPFDDALQCTPKLPQPKEWLNVGVRSPVIIEPHGLGAATKTYAKYFVFDKGEYDIGYAEKHFVEIFLYGEKIKGRYTLQFAPVGEKRIWIIRRQEDITPFVDREDLIKQFKEQKEKNRSHIYIAKPKLEPILIDINDTSLDEFRRILQKYSLIEEKTIKIINKNLDKQIVVGEVLIPDEVDAHGDIISAEEIERAAHEYLAKSRIIGLQHKETADAEVVESWISPIDFELNGSQIKKGTWIIAVKVNDSKLWDSIKSGEFQSFSFGGFALLN